MCVGVWLCVLGGYLFNRGEKEESHVGHLDPDQKICLLSCGQVSLRHQDSERDKAGVRNTPVVAHKGTSRTW